MAKAAILDRRPGIAFTSPAPIRGVAISTRWDQPCADDSPITVPGGDLVERQSPEVDHRPAVAGAPPPSAPPAGRAARSAARDRDGTVPTNSTRDARSGMNLVFMGWNLVGDQGTTGPAAPRWEAGPSRDHERPGRQCPPGPRPARPPRRPGEPGCMQATPASEESGVDRSALLSST